MIVVWILLALALLFLLVLWICFSLTFFVFKKQVYGPDDYDIPPGAAYEPYRDTMIAWMKEVRAVPYEEMRIMSFDGLSLYGRYYECQKGAPIELMMHGYRGAAERDLCGGVQRAFALGRNALIVDQRASGRSGGHVITFGVNESRDCVMWAEHLAKRFGEDVPIILTGISMGAATVMMAAGKPLPKNVIGLLADCGYTSAKEIICKVVREDVKLPPKLLYPLIKLSAKWFGGFDLEEQPPIEVMKCCPLPIIFIHGDTDAFVPCDMSVRNHEVCTAKKKLVIVKGADHGLSYMLDREEYLRQLKDFDYRA